MTNSIELYLDLFAFSGCFWIICSLWASFSIQRFLVKRYEEETDLLHTKFFKEHVSFSTYIPNFFSTAIYAGHLLMCIWGWNYFGTKKVYNDVGDPHIILDHFTKNELYKVKRYAIVGGITTLHFMALAFLFVIRSDVFA